MSSLKVAIVTLHGEFNYGNRLQNYAVQKSFEKLGCSAETVVSVERLPFTAQIKKYVRNILIFLNKYIFKRNSQWLREYEFKAFTRKYIPSRYIKTSDGKLPKKISDEYDYFVVGSDQVWNPTFGSYEKLYDNMFLMFTKREKKVCFSPSIGTSVIPLEWYEKFVTGFKTFPEISVREQDGANLIYKMTGICPQVLIDPTLMLTAEEWSQIASPVKCTENTLYVLEYFLGNRDKSVDDQIEQFTKTKGYQRYKLLDSSQQNLYCSGPHQFITLISHAAVVYTDSFHACVFSIIFGIPFVILKRKDYMPNMYSRIDTLLALFGIRDDIGSIENPIKIDKEIRQRVLINQQNKVKEFLINRIRACGGQV